MTTHPTRDPASGLMIGWHTVPHLESGLAGLAGEQRSVAIAVMAGPDTPAATLVLQVDAHDRPVSVTRHGHPQRETHAETVVLGDHDPGGLHEEVRRTWAEVERAWAAMQPIWQEYAAREEPVPLSADLGPESAAYREALLALEDAIAALFRPEQAPRHRHRRGPTALPTLVKFPADRIHAGTVQGLARVAEWTDGVGGFFRALEVEGRSGYRQLVGFYREPEAELWDFLRDRGEAAIKAHYALWARCYEETGGDPHKWVTMSVPQFCADLGYAHQKAGGYKTRDKQHAMRLLEALTTAELAVEARVGRKVRQITGPIWTRGLQARQRDEYDDLFGSQRVGDTTLWDPVGFTFRPGPWFEDEEWRKRNAYVGMVGAGLLRLDTRQDRWALRLGGYYGSLSRIGQYAQRSVTVATVLARTGLGKLNTRNPAEQEAAFVRGHDRLVEVGVLERWSWTGEEVTEEPDMDDPDTLTRLAAYGAGDWRRKRVSLTWPTVLGSEAARLETSQHLAIAATKRRRRRSPSSPSRG